LPPQEGWMERMAIIESRARQPQTLIYP